MALCEPINILAGALGLVEGKVCAFDQGLHVFAVNRATGTTTVRTIAYRRDSRVELFAAAGDWDAVEAALLACLVGSRGRAAGAQGE